MLSILRLTLTLLIIGWFGTATAAPRLIPAAPKVDASGYIVQDFQSGTIIAENNADERLEPASLTKMMTAYVVFYELANGNIKLTDQVRVSNKAYRMKGSRMFIEVGKQVAVEDLLKGMIIQSGNDASVALAEYVAGSEDAFVTLMNEHARVIGMKDTSFVNSTGWPADNHYSTARDMALLAGALIGHYPQYYKWYSEKKYTYANIPQYNRNKLLWRDKTVDGVKTGHTEAAGYCLVASADRDGMRLISVVMGTKSENARASESQKLLNYGFRFFETHKLYEAQAAIKTMRIWKGSQENLDLGLNETLYVTIPRGQYKKLKASMTVDEKLMAPVKQDQQLGSVQVRIGDELLIERPLVALQSISEGGLMERMVDGIKLFFE